MSATELFQYANALAIKNGFSPIASESPQRSADLVLPGEVLLLPDGRLLRVRPKQYIYDIAAKEYKRDVARMTLIAQQIEGYLQREPRNPEIISKIQDRMKDIERLAVTPIAKQRAAQISEKIKKAGL